ncbi:hypothetical protein GAMM_70007 [Gammaproteobacteria bacterium]
MNKFIELNQKKIGNVSGGEKSFYETYPEIAQQKADNVEYYIKGCQDALKNTLGSESTCKMKAAKWLIEEVGTTPHAANESIFTQFYKMFF